MSRHELVEIQNKKLDEFHLKDQIERMQHEVCCGRLVSVAGLLSIHWLARSCTSCCDCLARRCGVLWDAVGCGMYGEVRI